MHNLDQSSVSSNTSNALYFPSTSTPSAHMSAVEPRFRTVLMLSLPIQVVHLFAIPSLRLRVCTSDLEKLLAHFPSQNVRSGQGWRGLFPAVSLHSRCSYKDSWNSPPTPPPPRFLVRILCLHHLCITRTDTLPTSEPRKRYRKVRLYLVQIVIHYTIVKTFKSM